MSIDTTPPASASASASAKSTPAAAIDARLLITLALLSASAPFALDLYLPAFPAMVVDLSTTATGIQLSLTAFLIGAGVGHLIFGPLSDRVGRRRPLLVGATVYVLAGVVAALAPSVPFLVGARLLQGISGATGMVIGRAIVSDLARGREAARAFSLMMLVVGVAPVVAPVAGSILSGVIGWRGLLWIVAGLGVAALVASVLFVPETQAVSHPKGTSPDPKAPLAALFTRGFIGNALAFSFAFGTMIAYISASPFLYQDLIGMTELQYGLAFGLNALALTLTSGLSARLARRFAPSRLARTGLLVNFGAIAVITAFATLGAPSIWLTGPILVAVGSLGFVVGNTTALALREIPLAAGLGSAAIGVFQFGVAGTISPLVSLGGTASAVPLALTMLASSVIAVVAFLVAGQGHRSATAHPDSATSPGAEDTPTP